VQDSGVGGGGEAIINLESSEGRNVGRYSIVCFTRTIVAFNCQLCKNNGSVIVAYRETSLEILHNYFA
jgi:hypothetical protein